MLAHKIIRFLLWLLFVHKRRGENPENVFQKGAKGRNGWEKTKRSSNSSRRPLEEEEGGAGATIYCQSRIYMHRERLYILCWQQSHKAQELPCLRGSSALRKMKLFWSRQKSYEFRHYGHQQRRGLWPRNLTSFFNTPHTPPPSLGPSGAENTTKVKTPFCLISIRFQINDQHYISTVTCSTKVVRP